MTTTQTIRTLDGVDVNFGGHAHTNQFVILSLAQDTANTNGAPVGVWERYGWYTACEIDPDSLDVDPCVFGWSLAAVVDPE